MDMIRNYIASIPKLLLGAIAVVGALGFMIYNDPPTTVCDIQMQAVDRKLAGRFYSTKARGRLEADGRIAGGEGGGYQGGVMSSFNFCMKTNSPGGCYDIIKRLTYLEKQARTITDECGAHPSTLKVRKALEKGIKLIVKLAWQEKPPETLYEKTAWLEIADIALFCRMKEEHQRLYGKEAWAAFREATMLSLPEAKTISRKQRWEKSLFSYPCQRVL